MGSINTGRVVLGGLLAGLVINIAEFILHEVVLKAKWEAVMQSHNLPPAAGSSIAVFVLGGFLTGLLMIWLYAATRPRLGAGAGTAIKVGLVVWAIGCLLAMMPPLLMGMLPGGIVWTVIVWCLFEIPIAAVVGAWLYKE